MAALTAVPEGVTDSVQTLTIYTDVFTQIGLVTLGVTVVMAITVPMLNRLINKRETGILQQVRKAEEPILEKGDELLRQFRAKGKVTDAYQSFYNWVDQYIQKEYTNIARSHQIRID